MADDNSGILAALRGIDPADAMPFGAAATPQGSPTALSSMLSGLFGMPQHLVESATQALPGLRREDVTDIPGKGQPNDPLYHASTDTAMALAGTGAPAAEAGAAGIFGGKLAKTADLKALQEAERMRMHGEHPHNVWEDTGWFRSPTDQKWRFEIPDNLSKLGPSVPTVEGNSVSSGFSHMLNHPELFKAYPQMSHYPTMVTRDARVSGMFDNPKIYASAPDAYNARSVLLHEGQHGVQGIEGFSPGSDPAHFASLIEKGLRNQPEKFAAYDFDAIKKEANQLYHKTAGEVESRNVQKRMDYFPTERNAVPPWETQDVRYNDQLLYDPVKDIVEKLRR